MAQLVRNIDQIVHSIISGPLNRSIISFVRKGPWSIVRFMIWGHEILQLFGLTGSLRSDLTVLRDRVILRRLIATDSFAGTFKIAMIPIEKKDGPRFA